MFKILLASESEIKKTAVYNFFKDQLNCDIVMELINCDGCHLPPQPIDCGQQCATSRIDYVKKMSLDKNLNEWLIVSIEDDLVQENDSYQVYGYQNYSHVRLELLGFVGVGKSQRIKCPVDIKDCKFKDQPILTFSKYIKGYYKTAGEFLSEIFKVNPKNWMLDLYNLDREDLIIQALYKALDDLFSTVNKYYHMYHSYSTHPNFPKPGVNFKYFYSLFNGNGMNALVELLQRKYQYSEYNAVLPLESRGLVLGALLSDHLKITMIPFQKPGKIPGELISSDEYVKEYGNDEIVMSVELFEKQLIEGQKIYRFLIVDDLIASGGTIEASIKILDKFAQKFQFEYHVDILVLDEILELQIKAQEKIGNNYVVLFRNIDQCYQIMQSFSKIKK